MVNSVPYIGKYAKDLQERRENLVSLNTRVTKLGNKELHLRQTALILD